MSNPDHLNNQPLSKREQAILWIVWTTTPVDSDLVGDLTDKLGKVRDEAEGATANAVKANRELQHYYDDEWRYNEVERALRVLGGADQQFLFRIMIGYKW